MAGLIFETKPGLVFINSNGETEDNPYIVTANGTYSWSGAPIAVTRYKADGTSEIVNIAVPSEAQLQEIYDSNAAFAAFISPPDDYTAPWES